MATRVAKYGRLKGLNLMCVQQTKLSHGNVIYE